MLINAYCTHREPPSLTIEHQLRNHRDRSDPNLAEHLSGFVGFVMNRGERPMTATRYAVIRHIERVQHHLAIEVPDAKVNELATWATQVNAILFFTDGSIRAPNGAILVDPRSGDPEPNAQVPYPADALLRKAESEQRLRDAGIAVLQTLPPVTSVIEVKFRSPTDIAMRAIALLACALRAEALALGTSSTLVNAEILSKLPHAYEAMSPNEKAFFDAPQPSPQEVANHGWRYEALAVLAWALFLLPALPSATAICDVRALSKALLDAHVRSNYELRPPAVLLDALDHTFRSHWATTNARIKNQPAPGSLHPGVVKERHHALNWLIHFEGASWDDVQTPT
jgi:hypothetical protein